MKKILSTLLFSFALATFFSSCLKDKGYENYEYGIKDPSGGSLGISIPEASVGYKTIAVDASTSSQTVVVFNINLESAATASSDINVNLVLNPSLVSAYNSANGTNLVALPSSAYTFNAKITIKQGQRLGDVTVVIPNASTLNPTTSYGLGFSIASIDQTGYTIASNLKNMVVGFSIKNKYDGVYQLRGYHNRPSPDYTAPYNVKIHMITSGASSVVTWYPTPGPNTYAHPINGSTGSYYGSFAPDFTFNPTTNVCTGVQMYSGYPTLTMGLLGTTNRYVPATGSTPAMMYLSFNYNNNPLRSFFDTLTYIGPR